MVGVPRKEEHKAQDQYERKVDALVEFTWAPIPTFTSISGQFEWSISSATTWIS